MLHELYTYLKKYLKAHWVPYGQPKQEIQFIFSTPLELYTFIQQQGLQNYYVVGFITGQCRVQGVSVCTVFSGKSFNNGVNGMSLSLFGSGNHDINTCFICKNYVATALPSSSVFYGQILGYIIPVNY